MRDNRRVAIAGGGLAGLYAACALAQCGWRVNVIERSDELRTFGAGIWLWENGLRSLEGIGALKGVTARSVQVMRAWEVRDSQDRLVRRRIAHPDDRLWVPRREDLYQALVDRAAALGVDIKLGTLVEGADPGGALILDGGQRLQADLVLGADGVNSNVRASLALDRSVVEHPVGLYRTLIERTRSEVGDIAAEYWNGTLGVLYHGCSQSDMYLCFGGPISQIDAQEGHVDRGFWTAHFPQLKSAFTRMGQNLRWDRLSTIACWRWSKGRVAIIGDAAHGLTPFLGQAANLAFSNCHALAQFATGATDLPATLQHWEEVARPVTDHTQRWSDIYGRIAALWPTAWEWPRTATMRGITSIPYVEKQLNKAARTQPIGLRSAVNEVPS